METIEEQAALFAMEDDDGFAVIDVDRETGFIAGAEWMRDELTRWHDPKEELPEDDRYILLHLNNVRPYHVGYYDSRYLPKWPWRLIDIAIPADRVLGWREIPE